MSNFADKLTQKISEMNNPTVMGLDPILEYVPEHIKASMDTSGRIRQNIDETYFEYAAESILIFNKMLIDSVSGIIPAIKPQIAYYEALGPSGIKTFRETIVYAKSKGMIVIADCKRNDIGSTASMYSKAYLGYTDITEDIRLSAFDADAITVTPYLGVDGITPFIKDCKEHGKGIFILVRTSNPSAVDFQDIVASDGDHIYEKVAKKVHEWGRELVGNLGYSSVGAVVGATWPEQAKKIRKIMPDALVLVPGYGVQGGTGETVSSCFDKSGRGAIVNASRSLMLAYRRNGFNGKDFQEATYKEAIRMKEDLNRFISSRSRN